MNWKCQHCHHTVNLLMTTSLKIITDALLDSFKCTDLYFYFNRNQVVIKDE